MERIDIVILGAESVVESGGIVNKVCFCKKKNSKFLRVFFQNLMCN